MRSRDICVFLCVIAYLFIGYSAILIERMPDAIEPIIIEEHIDIIDEPTKEPYDIAMTMYQQYKNFVDTCPVICHTEPTDLENYSCLMYATEPIGRYYITAYNHLETGSKLTASGKTCHEGLITTCAADPKHHKFGEYLEIGGRVYVVEDTGSAVKKRHIDIYFASYKEMARYGSNYQTIYKVTWPFGKPKGV